MVKHDACKLFTEYLSTMYIFFINCNIDLIHLKEHKVRKINVLFWSRIWDKFGFLLGTTWRIWNEAGLDHMIAQSVMKQRYRRGEAPSLKENGYLLR